MAKTEIILGGGSLKRTLLWERNSSYSSQEFPYTSGSESNDVSLSDSIQNYDFIELLYRASTNTSSAVSVIIPVNAFTQCGTAATDQRPKYAISGRDTALVSATLVRGVTYNDNTSITISNAFKMNSSGTDNRIAVPTKIYGLKGEIS